MQDEMDPVSFTCPCGGTEIEVAALPDEAVACNCSYCSKKGALWGYYRPSQVRVVREDALGVWRPNVNEHHFCTRCGATTYTITDNWQREWQGPDAEEKQVSLNLRLVDGVEIASLPVEHIDGRTGWA
jgi:hypothetical protein